MQLLQELAKPPSSSSSSSGDTAQAMHTTIMQIVYPKFNAHLKLQERRQPVLRGVIDHLQQAIKPHKGFHVGRIFASSQGLPGNIMGVSENLRRTIRAAVRDLTIWSANASVIVPGISIVQPPPLAYSPRAMQLAAQVLGPSTVVQAIVEEVKSQTDTGNGAIAIDVATALVCAPTANDSPIAIPWSVTPAPITSESRSDVNLREALKLAFEDAPTQIKRDELTAQAAIRLYRRVEALCVGLNMNADAGLSAAAAAAAAAATAAVGTTSVVDGLAVDTATATQMQLDDAMGLGGVASAVDPMSGLLGDDALQQQSDVYDATAGMDLTAVDTGDLTMDLMGDGEDDIFNGLDLGGDLTFD